MNDIRRLARQGDNAPWCWRGSHRLGRLRNRWLRNGRRGGSHRAHCNRRRRCCGDDWPVGRRSDRDHWPLRHWRRCYRRRYHRAAAGLLTGLFLALLNSFQDIAGLLHLR